MDPLLQAVVRATNAEEGGGAAVAGSGGGAAAERRLALLLEVVRHGDPILGVEVSLKSLPRHCHVTATSLPRH